MTNAGGQSSLICAYCGQTLKGFTDARTETRGRGKNLLHIITCVDREACGRRVLESERRIVHAIEMVYGADSLKKI